MADSKRIYGIISLMLAKIRSLDSASGKTLEEGKSDVLKLQKMLAKELEK